MTAVVSRNRHKEASPARDLVAAHFEGSTTLPERFFEDNAARIARACWDMARRFDPCLPSGVHMYLGQGKVLRQRHSPMFGHGQA
jgi:hypothetical protein